MRTFSKKIHEDRIYSIKVSSEYILTASRDKSVKISSLDLELIGTIQHDGVVCGAAFCRIIPIEIISWDETGVIKLTETRTGKLLFSVESEPGNFPWKALLSFSRDTITACYKNGTVKSFRIR